MFKHDTYNIICNVTDGIVWVLIVRAASRFRLQFRMKDLCLIYCRNIVAKLFKKYFKQM